MLGYVLGRKNWESATWKLPFFVSWFELLASVVALTYFSLVCETAASHEVCSESENCWTFPVMKECGFPPLLQT